MTQSMKCRNIVFICVLLSSCASTPTIPVTGSTVASLRLQKDALTLLKAAFEAKAGCPVVDSVETESISIAADTKANQTGAVLQGVVKERWIAIGCGKRMPLDLTFTPDGKGGAYIGFTLQK